MAYFNIRIPELLGIFVNSLSRYAHLGSDEPFDTAQFLRDMRAPAANLFSLYILQSCFTFAYILLLSQIGEQMAAKLRQDLFKQIVIQDLSFFDANRTGELVNRLTADVQDFKSCFKQCVSQGLRSTAQLIGGLHRMSTLAECIESECFFFVFVQFQVVASRCFSSHRNWAQSR